MKKLFILSLLILSLTFGLTDAGSINVSCNGEQGLCRPTSFTIPESENITATINNCPYSETANFNINFSNGGGNNGLSIQGSCEDPYINREGSRAGTYNGGYFAVDDPECELNCEEYEEDTEEQEQCYTACNEGTDGTLTFTINYTESNGGSSGDGDAPLGSSSLLPSGVSSLSGVVSGLGDAVVEFIPYVVYVGLGILGALIGFFAIRWLINRARRQSFGVFKSKRRK